MSSSGSVGHSRKSHTSSKPRSARQVVQRFKRAGLPIGRVEVYTATTDLNHLLGRPGQYTSKANWIDTRIKGEGSSGTSIDSVRGGSVEVFGTLADASRRARYVRAVTQSSSAFVEYDFQRGSVLLRLSRDLTPAQASAYKAALKR